jgi:hypothetical protein
MTTRKAGIALALIALLTAPSACGRYGDPIRSRPTGPAGRSAPVDENPIAPTLAPADRAPSDGSGESGEECPPDQQPGQQPQQSAKKAEKP